MRIERYYSSIREEVSPFVPQALELLTRQDYVGFFKACGPNYIRGIRRAQEVTAIFNFRSTSTERASEYASSVQVATSWWNQRYSGGYARQNKFSSQNQSLKINIVGYGLGLTLEGSETLVATTLEDYHNVMKFAFNSMTKNKDSVDIGMVYGMEVVPWVENIQFQINSGIQEESIEVPLPRSLIPRAYRITDTSDTLFVTSARDQFRCKEPAYLIDRYGYCCERDAIFDYEEQEYDPEDLDNRICRPLRVLDKAIVSENMAANGEFVARLDRTVSFKLAQLQTMEKCISAARAIPDRLDYHILKPQDTVKYDTAMEFNFTVFEMKQSLDPFNNYDLLRHMAKELDEFMDMYYQPCVAALFGTNIGRTSDTDPSFFMAYPWHSHDECTYLSCLGNSMRWDRERGGCIPSLISGYNANQYEAGEAAFCSKDPDSGETETCKYDSSDLAEYHQAVTSGWREQIPLGRVDYFMERFCMPELTPNKISSAEECRLRLAHAVHTSREEMNVALNKPATQSSTDHGGIASRANDGNTDQRWRNGSIAHTGYQNEPWWEVDLRATFSISRIKVYNRVDCCKERLDGFSIYIYDNGAVSHTYNHSGSAGREVEIVLTSPVAGDKVRIQLNSDAYLNFAELEVWAPPGDVASCDNPTFPTWPDDFRFVNNGNRPSGYTCLQLYEGSPGWKNNWLCWKSDKAHPGIRWSYAGAIPDMRCTAITEGMYTNGYWNDNYLCVPNESKLQLSWTSHGQTGGRSCISFDDPEASGMTWSDNYLCGFIRY